MRTLLIAGNWKMNPATRAEAVALAEAVRSGVGHETGVRVVLSPQLDRTTNIVAFDIGVADRQMAADIADCHLRAR